MQTYFPLAQLYWGRIKVDLPWVALGVLIISTTQWHISFLENQWVFEQIQSLGRLLTLLLPLIGMLLALNWFCWAANVDITETRSYLHKFLSTMPIATWQLAAIPLLGGLVVALSTFFIIRLGDLPFYNESGQQIAHTLRHLPNTEWALLSLAISTYIWLQAILWQPLALRGLRLLLIMAVTLTYGVLAMGWISYQAIIAVPIPVILMSGAVGILVSLRAMKKARHDTVQTRPWLAHLSTKKNSTVFASKHQAQSHLDIKQHWYEVPIVAIPIWLFCLTAGAYIYKGPFWADWLLPLGELPEGMFVVIIVPIIMAVLSGIEFGTLRLNRTRSKHFIAPFYATLPISTGDIIQAKINASLKIFGLTYSFTILIAIVTHYPVLSGMLNIFVIPKVSLIETQLIFALGIASTIILVVMTQINSYWMGYALKFIPLGGFAVLIFSFPLLIIIIGLLEDFTLTEFLAQNKSSIKVWVYLLATIKLVTGGLLLKHINNKRLLNKCLISTSCLSIFVFSSLAYIGIRIIAGEMWTVLFIISVSFLLTPFLGILLYFPLFARERHG